MIQLMANEAQIIETLKEIEGIQHTPVSIGYTNPSTGYIIKRLVDMGVIKRFGKKKSFKYQIPEFTYMIIHRRNAGSGKNTEANEPIPQSTVEPSLTEDQIFYLQNHWDVLPRNILSRRLGLTKLQLNFYIDRNKAFLKSVVKEKQTSGNNALA
jgi:hypothetical protein